MTVVLFDSGRGLCRNDLGAAVLRQAVSPEREVIAMVTYSEMLVFVTMLTGVVTLCYLILKDKKSRVYT